MLKHIAFFQTYKYLLITKFFILGLGYTITHCVLGCTVLVHHYILAVLVTMAVDVVADVPAR